MLFILIVLNLVLILFNVKNLTKKIIKTIAINMMEPNVKLEIKKIFLVFDVDNDAFTLSFVVLVNNTVLVEFGFK